MLYANFMGNTYETGRVLLAVMSIVLLALPTLSLDYQLALGVEHLKKKVCANFRHCIYSF